MRIKLIVIVFLILMEEPRMMMVASAGWLGFFSSKSFAFVKSLLILFSPLTASFCLQAEMNWHAMIRMIFFSLPSVASRP